ncbi:hypothetical protein ACIP4U_22425 [Streptomyces caelestis]|uniref:hypothetical protein n=1 Tax=Streptomyces caelestis TaxID=36816 RepID=UPI0037F807A0
MRTDPRAVGRRAWSRFSWCAIDWRPRHPARVRHRRDGTLYAAANTAQADAVITAWDADLHYGTWRPVTAVREADTDGNPTTRADRHWEPLLVTPGPSRLSQWPHHYRYAHEYEQDVLDARVPGGIHTRTADEVGNATGRRLAVWALRTCFRPAP